MTLVPLLPDHWPAVRAIYEEGLATGNATFTTAAPTWEDWNAGHLAHSRLVAVDAAGVVRGWASLSPVSGRCVYGGVAEVSVYVAAATRQQGVGQHLLAALVRTVAQAHGVAGRGVVEMAVEPGRHWRRRLAQNSRKGQGRQEKQHGNAGKGKAWSKIVPSPESCGGPLVASPRPGGRFTGPKRRLAPVALAPARPAR